MRVALCSDLHLEFEDVTLSNTENAEVLILSGDIMLAADLHSHPPNVVSLYESYTELSKRQKTAQRFRAFLNRVSEEFPHVVYVAGNHEFYQGKWVASLDHLREECARYPNVHFLECDIKVINEVSFIGATLWTDCNKGDPITLNALSDMMNDYRVIRNDEHEYTKLRPSHTVHRHQQTLSYLKQVLVDLKDQKVVFVGHHAPSAMSTHDRYKHNVHSIMNGGYHSELSEFILDHPQIKLWTLGHMHDPHSYYIGDTYVVCNPRGYLGADPSADTFKLRYIDLDNLPNKFDGVNWTRD
jgi:DNA repair exonuclease SbcCD nuclease subunit